MWDFRVTPAPAYAPIVTPILDRVLVSVITRIKRSLMESLVAAVVRVVIVGVNLKGFKSLPVFWIGFGEVGKRRSVVL